MLRDAVKLLFVGVMFGTLAWAQQDESLIFSFNRINGNLPDGGLVADAQGNLYGTTFNGGSYGYGNVYKLTPTGTTWRESVLYTFTGGTDGAYPVSSLTFDQAGNLYGTAQAGGLGQCVKNGNQWLGCGVVFKLTPSGNNWQESTVYSFQVGVNMGVVPVGGVVFDNSGNLYGTTWAPGVGGGLVALRANRIQLPSTFWGCTLPGCGGTVFELTPTQSGWQEADIYAFTGGADGSSPQDNLILDSAGNLYGTAPYGGNSNRCQYGCGVVFKLAHGSGGWTESVLHSFSGNPDGGYPTGDLITDQSGNFYSTTSIGGSGGHGTVFELTPAGGENVLYSFTGGTDGSGPAAGVVMDSHGVLYGTTPQGGAHSVGVVYRLASTNGGWAETVLHSFLIDDNGKDGESPLAPVILLHGFLYGTTQSGGANYTPGAVYQVLP